MARLTVIVAVAAMTAGSSSGWADSLSQDSSDQGGIVYVMTNASAGNEILVFLRDPGGRLHALPGSTASTGGLGGSAIAAINPLGSQNSLIHSDDLGLLFAVNAGDNTVTAFNTTDGLAPRRLAVVPSGGEIPVSVAISEDRLYVLNAGASGAVATFAITSEGQLSQLSVFQLDLATGSVFNPALAPGQVGIDALARHLVVVHAGGQEVLVAELGDNGVPTGQLVSTPTPGVVPFSFDTTRYGSILVAEAGSGSVSAFDQPAGHSQLTPMLQKRWVDQMKR